MDDVKNNNAFVDDLLMSSFKNVAYGHSDLKNSNRSYLPVIFDL